MTKVRVERLEMFREGLTMALYLSLSLLAVMLVVFDGQSADGLWETILLTVIGLTFAHQIAFQLSTRLVTPGSLLSPASIAALRGQLIAAAIIASLTVIPVLIWGELGAFIATLMLLFFVLFIGYRVARGAPVSRIRALVYVSVIFILVGVLLVIKALGAH